jgi:hypothetical protein
MQSLALPCHACVMHMMCHTWFHVWTGEAAPGAGTVWPGSGTGEAAATKHGPNMAADGGEPRVVAETRAQSAMAVRAGWRRRRRLEHGGGGGLSTVAGPR